MTTVTLLSLNTSIRKLSALPDALSSHNHRAGKLAQEMISGLFGETAVLATDGEMHTCGRDMGTSQVARKLSDRKSQVKRLGGQWVEAPTGQRWGCLSSRKNVLIHESCDT